MPNEHSYMQLPQRTLKCASIIEVHTNAPHKHTLAPRRLNYAPMHLQSQPLMAPTCINASSDTQNALNQLKSSAL